MVLKISNQSKLLIVHSEDVTKERNGVLENYFSSKSSLRKIHFTVVFIYHLVMVIGLSEVQFGL